MTHPKKTEIILSDTLRDSPDTPDRPVLLLSTVPRSATYRLRYIFWFLNQAALGQTAPWDHEPDFNVHPLPGLGLESFQIGHFQAPGRDLWPEEALPGIQRTFDPLNPYIERDFFELGLTQNQIKAFDFGQNPSYHAVLAHRAPLSQTYSMYRHCRNHVVPALRDLAQQPFAKVAFSHFLPWYAIMMLGWQQTAAQHPERVHFLAYEALRDDTEAALKHLCSACLPLIGNQRLTPEIYAEVAAATSAAAMKTYEAAHGESLASDQLTREESHIRSGKDQAWSAHLNPAEARYALTWLAEMGVDPIFLQGRDGL